ncbi:Uu.00g086470.m01.CDS01 [Anthostomella pinea]|uniref:Uu.00g086470.m01.CDS01 n=1 Tax=Anthostomella pinea TaxID=933095 RepID=A0AAI8VM34_9PEZI|nr:Uu.00g086470.m01.CDS01 [Anthostomella pinea]
MKGLFAVLTVTGRVKDPIESVVWLPHKLPRTTTPSSKWPRLAQLKHPDKDKGNPNATAQFQLLQAAYSMLHDPVKRREYDSQRALVPNKNGSPANTAPSSADSGPDTRQQEEAQAARTAERDAMLEVLRKKQTTQDSPVFEARRQSRRMQAEMKDLREKLSKEKLSKENREEEAHNSWSRYLSSLVLRNQESEEAKLARRRGQLDLAAAIRIRDRGLEQQKRSLCDLVANLETTQAEIARITRETDQEKADAEAEKRRREERAAQRAWAETLAAMHRKQAEEAQRRQEQERRAREESARRAREQAERERKAAEERSRRMRHETPFHDITGGLYTRVPYAIYEPPPGRGTPPPVCAHRGWWGKISGSHLCSRYSTYTRLFAFKCPGCQKVACATCRRVLRGERARPDRSANQSHSTGYFEDYH